MKTKFRKILLVSAFVMLISVLFCFSAGALDSTGQCGDNVFWNFNTETGKFTLSGSGEMYDYASVEDNPWYAAGYSAKIKEIEIGENITKIGRNAFANCYELKTVTVPGNVKEIGKSAFELCINLETVVLSEGVEKIYAQAFIYNSMLKNISLPETLTFIDGTVFGACVRLESIKIPDGVKQIYSETFQGCVSLKDIEFPEGLTYLSGLRFCTSLESIVIPESTEEVGIFDNCYLVKEVIVPENVDKIGSNFLDDCLSLEDVYIYNSEADLSEARIGLISYDVEEAEKAELINILNESYFIMYDMKTRFENPAEFESRVNALEGRIDPYYCDEKPSPYVTIHGYKGSTAETYAETMGFKFEEIKKEIKIDSKTNVQAEYESGTITKDAKMVVTKGGVNANFVFSGLFSNYASYDISFEANGEKVQPIGNITIKIPLPLGFSSNSTKVYYVDENKNEILIHSVCENGYIVFETDHFSEYVLVDESSKIEEPTTEPEEPTDNCSCNCHKDGFMGIIWKILRFFYKIFGMNKTCACGISHY